MDLNEKRKLMVSANLTLEQLTSNMGRVMFPMKAPLTINKDVGIEFICFTRPHTHRYRLDNDGVLCLTCDDNGKILWRASSVEIADCLALV